MKVLLVGNYTYKNNNISCKSNNRKITLDGTEVYQTTSMFRGIYPEDIDFLWSEFEKEPKVNFINLACSDGSEPMSWAIGLTEKYGKAADKFFPIQASDIDFDIIYKAQNEPCLLSYEDVTKMKMFTNNDYFKYCYRERSDSLYYPFAISPKPELKSKIVYKIKDAKNAIEDIKDVPSFILCCNFLPYLQKEAREQFIKNLFAKFNKSSILKIGDFDLEHNIDKLLCSNGFEKYKRMGYFKKII